MYRINSMKLHINIPTILVAQIQKTRKKKELEEREKNTSTKQKISQT